MRDTALALLIAAAWVAAAPLPVDDASLLRQMPGEGIEYALPDRVFPPELIELLRHGDPVYRKLLYRSVPSQAPLWIGIPLDRWDELISDFAPVGAQGNGQNPATRGRSPFTGVFYAGTEMSVEEFLEHPFQARERGTDHIVYAREGDMPDDYPARPNHTEDIPHLDGTTHPYRFYVPDEYRDAGPEIGSDRRHWFCPAGEVWRARLRIICGQVIPDLVAAIVLEDNRAAIPTLAAVLDRIAEVYPELPLYGGNKSHGFARGPDHQDYLTIEQYRSITPRQPFIHARDRSEYPFWYVDNYDFHFGKLNYGVSAWTDGMMDTMGWVAGAFDLIRDLPETEAWSREQYGDPHAFTARFRERCLPEIEFLALATPPTTGNTSYAYITGSAKAGIATGNRELFAKGLEIIEMYLYNNWLPDGMAADAAFNYAGMTQSGILGLSWMTDFYGGVDLGERYPLKDRIDELGPTPIRSLLGIPSKHADQHAYIFRGHGAGPAPGALPYADHQASQCLPNYGMSVLRGGTPGHRTELIFDYQNARQHSHLSRLNYQLFFEGVDLLPDFGYTIGYIDPDKEPWSNVTTDYEWMGLPNDNTGRWGPWKWSYSDKPPAHNTVMVDYWAHQPTPCQLHGFAGADNPEDAGWWAQFADADTASLWAGRPNPVDLCRRQVALLTLPNGSPVVIDVTRVVGGQRHDIFWHVPADTPELPGEATSIDAPHLSAYLGMRANYDKVTGQTIHHYGRAGELITGLTRRDVPAGTWTSDWRIDPSRTFPRPEAWREPGNWEELLHAVDLRAWTRVGGSPATSELLSARGPWPGFLTIQDPETGNTTRATVGLKDALDYRIISREADEPGLVSAVVRILAPDSADNDPELRNVRLSAAQAPGAGGGVVCGLELADGSRGLVASTLNGETLRTPDIELSGRFGAVLPNAPRLALYDGEHLRAGGWEVEMAPSWEMVLTSVEGDLTGQPQTSALLVNSATPLPTDDTLVGQLVYVWHQVSEHLQTVYRIAAIDALGDGRWRLSLAHTPPFILQRSRVQSIDPEDRRKLRQTFQFHVLMNTTTYTAGRRIRFPRTGFETTLESCGRADFTVAEAPGPDQVAPGDPFVVYTIQAGDRVTIPSFFAVTGTTEGGTSTLRTTSSGPALLTTPAGQRLEIAPGTTTLTIDRN